MGGGAEPNLGGASRWPEVSWTAPAELPQIWNGCWNRGAGEMETETDGAAVRRRHATVATPAAVHGGEASTASWLRRSSTCRASNSKGTEERGGDARG
ncbi:hypothetical protein EUGRSUZ_E04290 [Eucalyptus grandis]|uniref:Uncharacterized protein n=2 Tax=Eucalyptus grandis TaxID=71139 RepID=A0ACC3L1P7_EUCGR|nr:hypothetical protein EUGRSUZ_E04290 [Eucalyptus grandis]